MVSSVHGTLSGWQSAKQQASSRCLLLACLAALACSPSSKEPKVECRSSAIVGGSERAELVVLAEAQNAAIVRLALRDGEVGELGACTAVLVMPTLLLTAAHCIPAEVDSLALYLSTEPEPRVPEAAVRHPELDLALLTLADEVTGGAVPIPVDVTYSAEPERLVQLAGYGRTEGGDGGALRFAAERIAESEDESFTVSAEGRAGACDGDSGGPAVSRDSDGSARVVGVLSRGSAGCADTDRYVRLAAAAEWLEDSGVWEGPALSLADCSSVGDSGRCFGKAALRCEAGAVLIEACGRGQVCGFDAASAAFGCVDPDDDTCEGVGDLGRCDGDERVRCEQGEVVSSPCAACGATCVASVRDGRAICNL